jgi:predicted nucleic acid-binding protein
MTKAMLDANVMVYAAAELADPVQYSDMHRMQLASKRLLSSNADLSISAVAWAEVLRNVTPDRRKALEPYSSKMVVVPFDAQAAECAAALLDKYRRLEDVCDWCLGVKHGGPCKKCERSLSRQQKVNDAFIIAVADCQGDGAVLYSFDKGVHDMGRHARCKVLEPPEPEHQAELFENVTAPLLPMGEIDPAAT